MANVNVSFLETHSGGRFRITIKDDGRGLELEKIRKVAVKKGFVSEEDSLNLSDYQIGNYIFQPGFSPRSDIYHCQKCTIHTRVYTSSISLILKLKARQLKKRNLSINIFGV